jgi:hypothetical protein
MKQVLLLKRYGHQLMIAFLAILLICSCDTRSYSRAKKLNLTPAQQRLDDFAIELVVDAVQGAEMNGVEFFADENEYSFYQSAVTKLSNNDKMALPVSPVPNKVRVTWRKQAYGAHPYWWVAPELADQFGNHRPDYEPPRRDPPLSSEQLLQEKIDRRKLIAKNLGYNHQGPWGGIFFGAALGDYTVSVASRIPDDLINDLKKNPRGNLRMKFRLHPDGFLFGWDIERRSISSQAVHSFVGGDFQEAKIVDGKAVRKGWYIDPKTKLRIETDF